MIYDHQGHISKDFNFISPHKYIFENYIRKSQSPFPRVDKLQPRQNGDFTNDILKLISGIKIVVPLFKFHKKVFSRVQLSKTKPFFSFWHWYDTCVNVSFWFSVQIFIWNTDHFSAKKSCEWWAVCVPENKKMPKWSGEPNDLNVVLGEQTFF